MGRKEVKNKIVIFLISFVLFICSAYSEENKPLYVSFKDITKLALENNLDIQIARFDVYIKRNNLKEANSIFDTFFYANIGYDKNRQDIASEILASKSFTNDYSLGLSKKIPSGTTFDLQGYNRRVWTNSPFSSLNPNTEANVRISLNQPLAKNFFGFIDRGNIKITKLDIKNTEWSSLDSIENSLALVQKAYWEFVLRYEELKIEKDMLKQAERLYNIYKEKIRNGLAEKSDLLASEANLSLRKNEVLQAEMRVEEAKNNLLYLINIADLSKGIIPVDELDTEVKTFDLFKELKDAIEKRRDYKIVKNKIDLENINISLKKNSLWPQIDLETSFTKNGIDANYKDAWEKFTSEDHSEWYVGLKIKFSLEKRKEKAEYNKAKLNKARLLLLLKKIERLIFKEINNSITRINTLANQVETNRKIVKLEEEKLLAEQEKLKYGRSSSDIIIRFQEDVLNARLRLAESLFSYRVSLINLERNKNTLLAKYWKQKI